MRLVLQQEATECALACLAMITNHFKSSIDLTDLRQRFPLSIRGTSVAELMSMAKELQLEAVAYVLKPNQLATISLPAILHWEANHYVVLSKISKKKGYYIADPAKGGYWLPLEAVSTAFTHIALVFSPTPTFLSVRHRVSHVHQSVRHFFSLNQTHIVLILVTTVLLQITILLFPQYAQQLFNPIVGQLTLYHLVLILCFYKVCEAVLFFIRGLIITLMDINITQHLSLKLFTHVMHLPLTFFETRSPATIFGRFAAIEKIRETANRGLLIGLIDGIFSFLILIIFIVYSLKLGAVIIGLTLIYFLVCHSLHQLTQPYHHLQTNQRAMETSLFLESIRGISSIKTAGQEATSIKRWHEKFRLALATTCKINLLNHALESTRILLFGAIFIATLMMGIQLTNLHLLSPQQLYALIFYLNTYIKSLTSVTGKFFDLKLCLSYATQLADIVKTTTEKEDTHPAPQTFNKNILTLQNINYRYHPQSAWILQNINLSIQPNTCNILFGPSGSGKTTLLKIMMGLLAPTAGDVYFHEYAITPNHLAWYRKQLCSIQQHDHLFSGTIYQNIAFFEEPINQNRVQECARIAEIHYDIAAMPMGYHSYLGDMGQSLSGGQKQRILLARALYKNPSLLILDEAFSNLDIETETRLYQSLKQLMITLIIVTHRKETLSIADQIIPMRASND